MTDESIEALRTKTASLQEWIVSLEVKVDLLAKMTLTPEDYQQFLRFAEEAKAKLFDQREHP